MKIVFDNPQLGMLTLVPPEGRLLEYVEAIITLGFEPEVLMA